MMRRRQALKLLGLTLAGGAAACFEEEEGDESAEDTPETNEEESEPGTPKDPDKKLVVIPEETRGPFPGDGSNGPDVLEVAGVVRRDVRSSFSGSSAVATGVSLIQEMTILDIANGGAPMEGAAVYIWHCDRKGLYSMYSRGARNENYLRGVQITDAQGKVSFQSIFPGCYPGRWPHIHFEVYKDQASIQDANLAIAVSQIAFPKGPSDEIYATPEYGSSASHFSKLSLATDGVFADDGAVHQLALMSGDVDQGYTANLTVVVDSSTTSPPGHRALGGPSMAHPFLAQ